MPNSMEREKSFLFLLTEKYLRVVFEKIFENVCQQNFFLSLSTDNMSFHNFHKFSTLASCISIVGAEILMRNHSQLFILRSDPLLDFNFVCLFDEYVFFFTSSQIFILYTILILRKIQAEIFSYSTNAWNYLLAVSFWICCLIDFFSFFERFFLVDNV